MPLTEPVTNLISIAAVVGQVFLAFLALVFLLALFIKPVAHFRDLLRRELGAAGLWLALLIALLATAGSLFFSGYANFLPCQLCWWQRIFMYSLVPTLLLGAIQKSRQVAIALIPLPIIGAGIATYHRYEEATVKAGADSCSKTGPSCTTNWINGLTIFDYITIPTLALTAFLLITVFLLLYIFRPHQDDRTEELNGEELVVETDEQE